MRIAILSDIHGNRTAFEAVLADLQQTSPDLILHGGDLADAGASPAEIVDRIRDLGWQGVGNTDEMLFRPESLEEFASHTQIGLQGPSTPPLRRCPSNSLSAPPDLHFIAPDHAHPKGSDLFRTAGVSPDLFYNFGMLTEETRQTQL
jgi:3',5'-cyclic AMP phosphodiesterase CpdA